MGVVTELKSLGEVRGQLFGVRIISFSDDGEQVATGDVGMELALWRNGQVVMRWDMNGDIRHWRLGDRIRSASFSSDGTAIYAASNESLWCLDAAVGSVRWERRSRGLFAFMRNNCLTAAALPDDRVIASYDDGRFELRERSGRQIARWPHKDCPRYMESVDEGRSVVGADNTTVGVWDISERRQTARFVPGDRIVGLAASKTGPLVAIRTIDDLIIWNRVSREVTARVVAETGLPCIDLCSAGDLIAVAYLDGLGVLDSTGRQVGHADTKGVRVLSVKFSPDGATLAAGCMDGSVRLWNVGSLLRRGRPQPQA